MNKIVACVCWEKALAVMYYCGVVVSHRHLPYIGMVTILMNDYPMLKVIQECIPIGTLIHPLPLVPQFALLGTLGIFVLINRE